MAQQWQQQYGLTSLVWGDTTDYMYYTFTGGAPVNGNYPSTMVIDLDTMTLRYFQTGGTSAAESVIRQILDEPHPCADL